MKTKKANNTPCIDYETISNIKRTVWYRIQMLFHMNYLNSCTKIHTEAIIRHLMCIRDYRNAILKTFKCFINLLKFPCVAELFRHL